jgi:hypothetical protein
MYGRMRGTETTNAIPMIAFAATLAAMPEPSPPWPFNSERIRDLGINRRSLTC